MRTILLGTEIGREKKQKAWTRKRRKKKWALFFCQSPGDAAALRPGEIRPHPQTVLTVRTDHISRPLNLGTMEHVRIF